VCVSSFRLRQNISILNISHSKRIYRPLYALYGYYVASESEAQWSSSFIRSLQCCYDIVVAIVVVANSLLIMPPTIGDVAISVAFVRPSVCLSVCPSVAYIANNSRTQRLGVPKFGRKVPHLRCDSHTSSKVIRSKVRVMRRARAYRAGRTRRQHCSL